MFRLFLTIFTKCNDHRLFLSVPLGDHPSSVLSTCGLDGADFRPLLQGLPCDSGLSKEKHGFNLGVDMLAVRILETDDTFRLGYQNFPQRDGRSAGKA
jgi:hypothetical protein